VAYGVDIDNLAERGCNVYMGQNYSEMAQNAICSSGVSGRWAGQYRNIYLLADAAGLFRFGSMLIDWGYRVETIAQVARSMRVSRQAIYNQYERDGKLIAIKYAGWHGQPTVFIVYKQ